MDERMDAPNGKRIVELLRRAAMGIYEGAKGKVMDNIAQLIGCYGAMDYRTIDKLADMVEEAIQHEHESAYDEGYDAGFASADDWCAQHEDAMAEHGWVRKSKEHVVSYATIEVTPHIDWSRMADELNEFVEIVRGMAGGAE